MFRSLPVWRFSGVTPDVVVQMFFTRERFMASSAGIRFILGYSLGVSLYGISSCNEQTLPSILTFSHSCPAQFLPWWNIHKHAGFSPVPAGNQNSAHEAQALIPVPRRTLFIEIWTQKMFTERAISEYMMLVKNKTKLALWESRRFIKILIQPI